jgi:hypothetical protein
LRDSSRFPAQFQHLVLTMEILSSGTHQWE